MKAIYNPDSLTRIKNGATAHELGWDEPFYASVCRKHGLRPVAYAPKTHILTEIAEKLIPALAPVEPPVELPPADGPCTFNTVTRVLQRAGHTAILPRRQADIFLHIIKGTPERPANGRVIGERMGLNGQGGVGGHVSVLRPRLELLNIKIHAVQDRERSGYFLQDIRSGEAIKVTVIA